MAACEALTLAKKAGIDPYKVRDALLGGAAQSFVMQNHAKRFLDGQLAPGFRTALLLKDLRLAAAATQDAGSFAPAGRRSLPEDRIDTPGFPAKLTARIFQRR